MIRAVIFDLDGTLVDAYPGIHASLNETLSTLGLPEVTLETVKRRVGRGVLNLLQQSVPSESIEPALQVFRLSYDRTHISGTFLLPDVERTLQKLQTKGFLLAVASNKPVEFTQNILDHFHLDRFFSAVAGPTRDIQPKPHPSMLRHILGKLNLEAQESLYVGDMTLDAETARNAGTHLALVATGGHKWEELKQETPDYLLNGFADLIKILDPEV
jgi:2-phosphoglycolate phosphatase